VIILDNGIDAWKDSGLPVEGESAPNKKSDSSYD
jgi:3-mercaptopyruvate sulfurtransferase SseA